MRRFQTYGGKTREAGFVRASPYATCRTLRYGGPSRPSPSHHRPGRYNDTRKESVFQPNPPKKQGRSWVQVRGPFQPSTFQRRLDLCIASASSRTQIFKC